MRKKFNRILSGILALSIIAPGLSSAIPYQVNAQQTSGNAPFINTWLVSGPFEEAVADEIYGIETTQRPTDGNWARVADISATSKWWSDNEAAGKAIDGDKNTSWISRTSPDNWEIRESDDDIYGRDPKPTLTLNWDEPIKVKKLEIFDRKDSAPNNLDTTEVLCTLYDTDGTELAQQTILDPTFEAAGIWDLETAVEGVSKITMQIVYDGVNERRNHGLGFSEVNVFDGDGVQEPEDPTEEITPVLGKTFGIEGEETHQWEYFDDRLYNRTYDDYQDLMGYYTVKKGIDTKNKYLYAHSYVYSPVEQEAYFCVGATGSYRMYVNDLCVSGAPTVPDADPQKDDTKVKVTLKAGWNKLLIQLFHSYTEDVDEDGVPLGGDASAAYAGFYGRVTDASGNEIENLTYSVTGASKNLEIVSQSLSSEEATENILPENNMPTGYKEWPYVWNKSVSENQYGVSASAFQFMAAGGAPGYTWEIIDGELPMGLELNPDGTIADGLDENGKSSLDSDKGIISIDCEPGDYSFTVKVTDAEGNSAEKEFTITVKERPNKWFEEGRVGALTHATCIYNYFVDPNYDVDGWAERAKRQGHSLVSVETIQQAYLWPSKFANPNHDRHQYLPKDEDGKLLDGIKPFEEAVKRYGMKFGLYYGGGIPLFTTDVYVQNLSDLIERYDPDYIYFDGPQEMGRRGQNFDIIYSAVRNFSNDIVINSNAWGAEYGDPDLRTEEAAGIYSGGWNDHMVKQTVMEPWKMIRTKNGQSPYYGKRDDYRQVIKEMIMNTGRNYVDNNDQTVVDSRGPNWDSVSDISTRYCMALQEFIDLRELVSAWFAPEGKPDRHESTTGTEPYFLSGYGFEDDGKGNYDEYALTKNGYGPNWGYATYRDNNIYLHIIEGPDNKKGFDAISDNSLTISPVKDTVTSVSWLNEDQPVKFTQSGESLTIDLSNVEEDQIDTIIKIETDNPERKYKLTNLDIYGEQVSDSAVQLRAEGYMTFPALKAQLENVTYTVESEDGADLSVDENGLVTASGSQNGSGVIKVSGTYEGVTVSNTIKMSVQSGKVYIGEALVGATLKIDGRESYGEFKRQQSLEYSLTGRSEKGGDTGLVAADITWHAGIVDANAGTKTAPLVVNEVNTFSFENGKIILPFVEEKTRAAVWADIKLDGQSFTTNKVFIDILPNQNLAPNAEVTASNNQDQANSLVDETIFEGATFDASKWSVNTEEESWVAFKLDNKAAISDVAITFNTLDQRYYNTPKTIQIQTSENGQDWETVKTINGPTGTSYFGFYDQYDLDVTTQYLRLYFPDGSNGETIDLLEVAINGGDAASTLRDIELTPTVNDEKTQIDVEVSGIAADGNALDLSDAEISMTSSDPSVAVVDEEAQTVTAGNTAGRAKITVVATKNGSATDYFYVDVDESGKIDLSQYIKSIDVSFSKDVLKYGEALAMNLSGVMTDGQKTDLSDAEIEYQFSDERLKLMDSTDNIITLTEEVDNGFTANVIVKATVNGITTESAPISFTVEGKNVACTGSQVEVSSGTQYEFESKEKLVDGSPTTKWCSARDDENKVQWAVVDLGEFADINSYRVLHANVAGEGKEKNTSAFKLQYSVKENPDGNNNDDWIDADVVEGNTEDITERDLAESIHTRYVRLYITEPVQPSTGAKIARIYELELFGSKENSIAGTVSEVISPEAITVKSGTEFAELSLPESTKVVLEDGRTFELPVTWSEEGYEKDQAGSYILKGSFDVSLDMLKMLNPEEKEPQMTVTVEKKETVDKTLLQKTYDNALTLDTEGVTESAVKFFEEAKTAAKAVLDNPNATQEEVNAAWVNLLKGIWGLGLTQGDKSQLELLISRADQMMADADKYVKDHWDQLENALKAAKDVMADGDAMNEDIQSAADSLLNAILAQRYKADKSILEDLIHKAESMDLEGYTTESVAVFRAALKNANLVLADENLSEDDQEVVDNAVKDLTEAIENLSAVDEKDPSDSSETDNGDSSDKPDNEEKTESPTTGDSSNILFWFTTVFAGLMLAVLGFTRKRNFYHN